MSPEIRVQDYVSKLEIGVKQSFDCQTIGSRFRVQIQISESLTVEFEGNREAIAEAFRKAAKEMDRLQPPERILTEGHG